LDQDSDWDQAWDQDQDTNDTRGFQKVFPKTTEGFHEMPKFPQKAQDSSSCQRPSWHRPFSYHHLTVTKGLQPIEYSRIWLIQEIMQSGVNPSLIWNLDCKVRENKYIYIYRYGYIKTINLWK
jgi:hypothetical protein